MQSINFKLDLTADVIDVRDIIECVESLDDDVHLNGEGDHIAECNALHVILYNLSGNGGDEQWRGDWYPLELVRDSYFQEYAQELCENIGDVPKNLPSYIQIDWEATARNIRTDYTATDINGVTYWYR